MYQQKWESNIDLSNILSLLILILLSCRINEIYPYLKIKDLRKDLIAKAKRMAVNQNPEHLWKDMDDKQFLRSAGLYQTDYKTQEEGMTLAFGSR